MYIYIYIYIYISTGPSPRAPKAFGNSRPPTWGSPRPDWLIAKVDGPGHVDLLRIFVKISPPHLYMYIYIYILHIFHFFIYN